MLTVYGIETSPRYQPFWHPSSQVATVLTVYGIETEKFEARVQALCALQQCLPFTVLKLVLRILRKGRLGYGCNSAYRLRY